MEKPSLQWILGKIKCNMGSWNWTESKCHWQSLAHPLQQAVMVVQVDCVTVFVTWYVPRRCSFHNEDGLQVPGYEAGHGMTGNGANLIWPIIVLINQPNQEAPNKHSIDWFIWKRVQEMNPTRSQKSYIIMTPCPTKLMWVGGVLVSPCLPVCSFVFPSPCV